MTIELPPVVLNVVIDPHLDPVDVCVWVVAVTLTPLDDVEFREVKLTPIALVLRKSTALISVSLRRLCSQGYLEVAPKHAGTANAFRLSSMQRTPSIPSGSVQRPRMISRGLPRDD